MREVLAQLTETPFLLPLILEASFQISKYFPEARLDLEVDDTEAKLWLIIVTSSSPGEASNCLDQFDAAWWFGALDRAQGKLGICLGFELSFK